MYFNELKWMIELKKYWLSKIKNSKINKKVEIKRKCIVIKS